MMETSIVVIDNDEGMRGLFMYCLKREGWQVFSYPYTHIDLVGLEQHQPHLIILDFNLNDGGMGWEFLQLLKMEDATANIPILITTTAFDLSAEIQDFLLTRYIRVLHKPFDPGSFISVVQETLMLASQSGVIFVSERTLPVLVVDDTEDIRDAISLVLTMEGYEVAMAFNGQVALEAVSRADHCLILLDIAMPIMNGYEFLKAYDRQLRPHAPVAILSGEPDIHTKVLPSFVVDVIHKPFGVRQVLKLAEMYAQPA